MASQVKVMIYSQNLDQIKPKLLLLSKSIFGEPWYGGLTAATYWGTPVSISAWKGARDEILGS